jgi:hypothetical protein
LSATRRQLTRIAARSFIGPIDRPGAARLPERMDWIPVNISRLVRVYRIQDHEMPAAEGNFLRSALCPLIMRLARTRPWKFDKLNQ